MKKLLSIFALAVLTLSATFATTTTSDINVTGNVEEIRYNFDIMYNTYKLTSGGTIVDSIFLNVSTYTNYFIVRRSAGNRNNNSVLTIGVKTNPFIGSFNGNEAYNTELIPEIEIDESEKYTYSETPTLINNNSDATMKVIIPAGAQESAKDLAAFKLLTKGNSSIPAGSFTSIVNISITYEQ